MGPATFLEAASLARGLVKMMRTKTGMTIPEAYDKGGDTRSDRSAGK